MRAAETGIIERNGRTAVGFLACVEIEGAIEIESCFRDDMTGRQREQIAAALRELAGQLATGRNLSLCA